MTTSSLLFLLLTAIFGFALIAKRLRMPYPIAFVIGGSLLALFPHLPPIRIHPNLVFLIILPPLLFSGGWSTDWVVFRNNLRPIALLSIGLVIATTVAVALATHWLVPSIGWAAAFALGAIVSPPDEVAAAAVFERFSIPRRIRAILEGESLVNDATALVLYRFAIVAAVSGAFSLLNASVAFVLVATGGIAFGLAFGWVYISCVRAIRRFELNDYLLDNVLALIGPYAVYLLTDAITIGGFGPSPVLATVVAGLYISRRSAEIFDPDSRLLAGAVWDMLIFLLNGLVFLLIGLQLRSIIADPSFALRELWIGVIVSALVIVVRVVWLFPATYIPRWIWHSIVEREGWPPIKYIFVIGWSGMRGLVSLAAALALPLDFPGRNIIFFITFCVIVATLVGQGLSLIPLLRWLNVTSDEDLERREVEVRVTALRSGVARLHELEKDFNSTEEWEVEGRLLGEYEYRIAHLLSHLDARKDGAGQEADEIAVDHRLEKEALDAERREVIRMRAAGEIPDEVYRKIEYDLDLAAERLR